MPSVNLRPTLQPFAIPRCSSLQIPKNAPCSLSRENSLQHLGTITNFHRQRTGLSLHFVQISLQIANCRENGRRDRFASDCILSQAVVSLSVNSAARPKLATQIALCAGRKKAPPWRDFSCGTSKRSKFGGDHEEGNLPIIYRGTATVTARSVQGPLRHLRQQP